MVFLLWMLIGWGEKAVLKQSTNVAVSKDRGQALPDQTPGEDLVVFLLSGINNAQQKARPKSILQTGRAAIHQNNRERVMAVYGPELTSLDGLTPEDALAISPKLPPSRVWTVAEQCGDTYVSGQAKVWASYGDLELVGDIGHARWLLYALEEAGPELPAAWSSMTVEERYHWQNQENFVVIGIRRAAPDETEPEALRLRPVSYFTYFNEEHDWCDPFHQDEDGNCRGRNTEIAAPLRLAMASAGDPITWQVDYFVGEIGAYRDGWRRHQKSTVFGQYHAPRFEKDAANFHVDPLPDVIDVQLECP